LARLGAIAGRGLRLSSLFRHINFTWRFFADKSESEFGGITFNRQRLICSRSFVRLFHFKPHINNIRRCDVEVFDLQIADDEKHLFKPEAALCLFKPAIVREVNPCHIGEVSLRDVALDSHLFDLLRLAFCNKDAPGFFFLFFLRVNARTANPATAISRQRHVLLVGASVKVRGIAARRIITRVADFHAFRDFAGCSLIRINMSANHDALFNSELPIASWPAPAGPLPAITLRPLPGRFINLFPESLIERAPPYRRETSSLSCLGCRRAHAVPLRRQILPVFHKLAVTVHYKHDQTRHGFQSRSRRSLTEPAIEIVWETDMPPVIALLFVLRFFHSVVMVPNGTNPVNYKITLTTKGVRY
jgi:hypothetical protein